MRRSAQNSRTATKLSDHIRELAIRLLASAVVLVISGVVVYIFYEPLLNLLRSPLNAPLYYNTPIGSFSLVMKVCLMGALTIAIPFITYNLIMFVRPAFEKLVSKKQIYITTIASSILAIMGATFAFTCILPGTLEFFAGFQTDGVNALISADSYLSFVTNIIMTFVLIFQLPLLITFIDSIKPLKPKDLFKMEKWVILGSLIIALIAPFTYDFMTSLLIAAPIIALYNLSILIVIAIHARANHKAHSVARKAKAKPAIIADLIPNTTLSFNNLVSEIAQPKPIETASITTTKYRTFMDISRPTAKIVRTTPIVKICTKPNQTILNNRVRLISDIRTRTNRVLA